MSKKEKTQDEKPGVFFKAYFIILIIFSVLGIIDALFVSGRVNIFSLYERPAFSFLIIAWVFFMLLFELAFLVLSIIAVFKFINKKIYLALTAPILHFASLILFASFGLFRIAFTPEGFIRPIISISSAFVNIFLLVFSIFILIKYK
ncbi:MAG: hypothetical protein QXW65_02230 [Candidatus Pacearchaeota archaeon]